MVFVNEQNIAILFVAIVSSSLRHWMWLTQHDKRAKKYEDDKKDNNNRNSRAENEK